ncbi:histone deacetylase 14 [Carex littledalei]|uniref:Histone deacetylase 14 n=1 Tax=Carex littledalei TaxID=544730 RepID=A0A833RDM9_9POAL|nr:histone deacetylase 14 [Carex littledalei]
MEVSSGLSLPTLLGRLMPYVQKGWNLSRKYHQFNGAIKFSSYSKRGYACIRSNFIAHCSSNDLNLDLPNKLIHNASVIYCVSAAMGHNKESHPECNKRVPAIVDALERLELSAKYRSSQVYEIQNFQPASLDDIARVHSRSYVTGLEKVMSRASDEGLIFIEGSGPTYATGTTFQESLLAAGAGMSLVDAVVEASRVNRDPPVGFALIRPPGHHAVPEGPMGFCVFGNIAVAARYAQNKYGLKRVMIIDFDVHHGNGTHDAFYDDPDIFFLSTHQAGSYPGTGKIEQVGAGSGEGTTLNLPLPGGAGDYTMRSVFDEVIAPSAQRFKPDIILVSAGYDAHALDPLAGLQFTTGTYYMLASNIKQLAKELCSGRCIFFLEGGYNLQSLSSSVADTFRALLGEPSLAPQFDNPAMLYEEPLNKVKQTVERAKTIMPRIENAQIQCFRFSVQHYTGTAHDCMSSKELEESLSELQVGKRQVSHGENGENKSVQNDMSKGEVQVSCFTEDLHDVTLHFQIVKFSKQIYAWIGCNSVKLGHLYAAATTRPNNIVSVTSILGGTSDNTGSSIARRLVSKTGLNIVVACNIPKDSPMLEATAERKLTERLAGLGYFRPREL